MLGQNFFSLKNLEVWLGFDPNKKSNPKSREIAESLMENPLVNVYKPWKDPPFSMGKLAISMAMFNNYMCNYQSVSNLLPSLILQKLGIITAGLVTAQ